MDDGMRDPGYFTDESQELWHYGTPRHSGRYPWGSGKNPQRNKNFYQRANWLKKQYPEWTDTDMARAFQMSTTRYRAQYSISMNEHKAEQDMKIRKLHDKGWSNTAIADKLGVSEGTIRNSLKDKRATKGSTEMLADRLVQEMETKPYLMVGKGVDIQLGVNPTKLDTSVEYLHQQGYEVHSFNVPQATNPMQKTEIKVICPPGTTYKEVRENQDKIVPPGGFFVKDDEVHDIKPPSSIKADRVYVRYAEDGGIDKDGTIEIRPGVPDLSLGENHYAQVRIAVNGTHYLKGMALYSNHVPDGYDIVFNTNKHKDVPALGDDKDHTVLKKLKLDQPENPFGAVINRQGPDYTDKDGKEHQSAINIVNDDTDWNKWSKNLPAQFLSKQPVPLAKRQLDADLQRRQQEFDEICSLTNPTVKKKLLEEFAESADGAAVNLKAAALPRQATHVLLPVPSLKDNEIYAPNYRNGEEVVLIRFPHAGLFEIPRLRVNNDNVDAKESIGNAKHAVGINPVVAQQLSGADFDGDTVIVIPTKGTGIRTDIARKELINFEPKEAYRAYEGMPRVGKKTDGFNKPMEMGKVSNLINDMNMKGASFDEICRAVKYSMVVIDAEKHNLNWKQAYEDLNIPQLYQEWQGKRTGGASTLISRAKGDFRPPEREELKAEYRMTEEEKARFREGYRVFRETGRFKNVKTVDPDTGEVVYVKSNTLANGPKSTKMAETDDAFTLASGGSRETAHHMEQVYGDYANACKSLARQARKEYLNTGSIKVNAAAKEEYKAERTSLLSKLATALSNSPLERQAQLIADTKIKAAFAEHPDWDDDDKKKHRQIYITQARAAVQAQSRKQLGIRLSDREWDAIQAGAISESTLRDILRFTDIDEVRQRAMPRQQRGLSSAQRVRARTLLDSGRYTPAEVAEELGVSVSTMYNELAT